MNIIKNPIISEFVCPNCFEVLFIGQEVSIPIECSCGAVYPSCDTGNRLEGLTKKESYKNSLSVLFGYVINKRGLTKEEVKQILESFG